MSSRVIGGSVDLAVRRAHTVQAHSRTSLGVAEGMNELHDCQAQYAQTWPWTPTDGELENAGRQSCIEKILPVM